MPEVEDIGLLKNHIGMFLAVTWAEFETSKSIDIPGVSKFTYSWMVPYTLRRGLGFFGQNIQ